MEGQGKPREPVQGELQSGVGGVVPTWCGYLLVYLYWYYWWHVANLVVDILYLKHLVNGQYKGNQRFGVDICYLENLENANLVLVNHARRALTGAVARPTQDKWGFNKLMDESCAFGWKKTQSGQNSCCFTFILKKHMLAKKSLQTRPCGASQ